MLGVIGLDVYVMADWEESASEHGFIKCYW